MTGIRRLITDEPVLLVGLAQALLAMLLAFGLNWSNEQVGMVLAFTSTLLAVVARAMVTPTANVEQQVTKQVARERALDDSTMSMEEYATLVELRRERDRLKSDVARRLDAERHRG